MSAQDLTQVLIESFNALADEVQSLSDRQTVLEHKLRYAHEQFQHLADKYAPASDEIADTLAQLQLPPELNGSSLANTNSVPLPRRRASSAKHQIAVVIRQGRQVASALSSPSKSSKSSRGSIAPTTMTSLSTILEQDFTVEGKKQGTLGCPFSQMASLDDQADADPTQPTAGEGAHDAADPICAAMYDEAGSQQASTAAANKCPIRYMDQHSPEEIAHYLETHKHELPRSHEVCVRRYQRNEDHIRKLDAKYGNLVSMVQGLSKIHQPMLPEQDTRPQSEVEHGSNERVETWAQTVSAVSGSLSDEDPDRATLEGDDTDEERQSHFDRPLKEVRVGESPSRPWGISVPFVEIPAGREGFPPERPESPPPAPVHMPADHPASERGTPGKKLSGKCPFDHTQLAAMMGGNATPHKSDHLVEEVHLADTPTAGGEHEGFTPKRKELSPSSEPHFDAQTPKNVRSHYPLDQEHTHYREQPQPQTPHQPQTRYGFGQPTFLAGPGLNAAKPNGQVPSAPAPTPAPQMVFTGPVFIGYPMEQAIQFMQHFQGPQQQQH